VTSYTYTHRIGKNTHTTTKDRPDDQTAIRRGKDLYRVNLIAVQDDRGQVIWGALPHQSTGGAHATEWKPYAAQRTTRVTNKDGTPASPGEYRTHETGLDGLPICRLGQEWPDPEVWLQLGPGLVDCGYCNAINGG
jgi:hypothetical protein